MIKISALSAVDGRPTSEFVPIELSAWQQRAGQPPTISFKWSELQGGTDVFTGPTYFDIGVQDRDGSYPTLRNARFRLSTDTVSRDDSNARVHTTTGVGILSGTDGVLVGPPQVDQWVIAVPRQRTFSASSVWLLLNTIWNQATGRGCLVGYKTDMNYSDWTETQDWSYDMTATLWHVLSDLFAQKKIEFHCYNEVIAIYSPGKRSTNLTKGLNPVIIPDMWMTGITNKTSCDGMANASLLLAPTADSAAALPNWYANTAVPRPYGRLEIGGSLPTVSNANYTAYKIGPDLYRTRTEPLVEYARQWPITERYHPIPGIDFNVGDVVSVETVPGTFKPVVVQEATLAQAPDGAMTASASFNSVIDDRPVTLARQQTVGAYAMTKVSRI